MDPTKWQGVMVDGQKFAKSDSNANLLIIPDFKQIYLSKRDYSLLRPMGNFKTVECLIAFFGDGINPRITANSQVVKLNTGVTPNDFGVYKIILNNTNLGQTFSLDVSYYVGSGMSQTNQFSFLLTQSNLSFSISAQMYTFFLGAYATY